MISPSSSSFIPETVLSGAWLNDCLDEANWRFRLLGGLLKFAVASLDSIEVLGNDYLLHFKRPIHRKELEIFLDSYKRLSSGNPVLQKETDTLYLLLHQP
ncbi:MAG: hypothetical protein ACFFB3_09465 [Candidatus Hodarchaeota archaeon]